MADILILGEVLIDMIATERNVTLFEAPSFEPKPGGAPANVAVGVARLGRSSALIGRVGPDDFGQGLRDLLCAEGVDTSCLMTDPEHMTTLAMVSLSDRGDPHFAIYLTASAQLQPADLDESMFASARMFHFSSVSLAREPSRSATLEGLKLAQKYGVMCSYDVNWRPAIWPDLAAGVAIIKQPIPQIDLLKLNASELALITGVMDPREALAGLDAPAPLVMVTLGEAGCLYRFENEIFAEAGEPVAHVVDATGAGDAFMAVLLADLQFPLAADAIARAARRACRAGAISVARRGAIPSLPYPQDLADFPA